jgi:hypothetical protein
MRPSPTWPRAAGAAYTVPVSLFLLTVWALQLRPQRAGWHAALVPTTALLVLAATLTPEPVLVTGLLMAALLTSSVVAAPHLHATNTPGATTPTP